MGLPFYLAMTAGEIQSAAQLPKHMAYMACHFSPYSTGLSNVPQQLPPGSLLMVNDRIPICRHDGAHILRQLREAVESLSCAGVILDLQREDCQEQQALCRQLSQALPCPVAVSGLYARDLSCPVFLSAPRINGSLRQWISLYEGREVWLEAALDQQCFTVTPEGCSVTPILEEPPVECLVARDLHCRYTLETEEKAVRIRLWRTADDLAAMLSEAESLGITRAIGLYQELKCTQED